MKLTNLLQGQDSRREYACCAAHGLGENTIGKEGGVCWQHNLTLSTPLRSNSNHRIINYCQRFYNPGSCWSRYIGYRVRGGLKGYGVFDGYKTCIKGAFYQHRKGFGIEVSLLCPCNLAPEIRGSLTFTPVCKGRDLNRVKKEKVSFLTECNGPTYSRSSPAKDLLLVVEQLGHFQIRRIHHISGVHHKDFSIPIKEYKQQASSRPFRNQALEMETPFLLHQPGPTLAISQLVPFNDPKEESSLLTSCAYK